MRRFLLGVGALILIGTAAVYAFRVPLTLRGFDRVMSQTLGTNRLDGFPEGLHVALCGAGSPLPDPDRSGPCVAVIAGDRIFLVDTGAGSPRTLARMRLPLGSIEAVFLTHFHSDHIDGLGEMMMQRWVNGTHTTPLPIYGPTGVERVVAGFNAAYSQDSAYRTAHHGEATVPRSGAGGAALPFEAPELGEARVVLESQGLRVTAFRVNHDPIDPAIGYRFDYAGRSIVVSGDTIKSANLQQFAAGADVLVHEALSQRLVGRMQRAAQSAGRANLAKILLDIQNYHVTPTEVAEIARDAAVGHLLYYHMVPPLRFAPLADVFLEGVEQIYDGPVTVGTDGTFLMLPAGSDAIETGSLL
jgi:ribonuclease Z